MATKDPTKRLNSRVIGICIAAALGGFLFGFDTSVINGAVDALSEQFSLGPGLTGFAVSSALIGCALGAWFAGPVANRLGRPRLTSRDRPLGERRRQRGGGAGRRRRADRTVSTTAAMTTRTPRPWRPGESSAPPATTPATSTTTPASPSR